MGDNKTFIRIVKLVKSLNYNPSGNYADYVIIV